MEGNESPRKAEQFEGQAAKLIDLAAYQSGSVVSTEIINKKTGTVMLLIMIRS